MTKDYRKEMEDLQKECAYNQGRIYRLLEKVLNEHTALDMERDRLERQVKFTKAQLNGKELENIELRTRVEELEKKNIVRPWDTPRPVSNPDDRSDRAKFKRTINSLQKKLDEETVELSLIVKKIQKRAETHGIEAANLMYDTICLLLDDVVGWKKNKAGLDKYFQEYRNRKSNIVKIQGDIDQMIVENNGTVKHN